MSENFLRFSACESHPDQNEPVVIHPDGLTNRPVFPKPSFSLEVFPVGAQNKNSSQLTILTRARESTLEVGRRKHPRA